MYQRLVICLVFAIASHIGSATEPEKSHELAVRVIDSDGEPIAGATVKRSVWTDQKDFDRNSDYVTDEAGRVAVTLPTNMRILRLWISNEGSPTLFANFSGSAISEIPETLTVRVPKPATVGGVILDQQGNPIEGARVAVTLDEGGDPIGHPALQYSRWLADDEEAAVTDKDGRWSVKNIPPGDDVKLDLHLSHAGFVSDQRPGESQAAQGVTMELLRKQTATMTMQRGLRLRRRIVDEQGGPIENAAIHWNRDQRWGDEENMIKTDSNGRFRSTPITAGPLFLSVAAKVHSPRQLRIELDDDTQPLEVALSPGGTIAIRVVAPDGKPIPDAEVTVSSWLKLKPHAIGRRIELFDVCPIADTDKNGETTWRSAPEDAIEFLVRKQGWSMATAELLPSPRTQVVELPRQAIISGTVIDDSTGEPIENAELLPVTHYPTRPDDPILQGSQLKRLADGSFEYTKTTWIEQTELILQFQATGYRPVRIGPFGPSTGTVTQEVRLQQAKPLKGRVVDPSGRPVSGASLVFATKDVTLFARDWTYRRSGSNDLAVRTDDRGYFQAPQPFNPPHLVASHESGFAEITLEKNQTPSVLKLEPWSRVEGRLERNERGVVGEHIYLRPIRMLGGDNPGIQDSFMATTDADGRFVFDRVPPVPSSLYGLASVWSDTTLKAAKHVPLDLKPGETREVHLGTGVTVRGIVRPQGELANKLDMTYCLNYLLKRAPGIQPPKRVGDAEFDWHSGWSFNLRDSTEGRGFLSTMTYHFVKFESDGSFEIHGVEPGTHQFATSIYEPPEGCLVDPVGRRVIDVNVDSEAVKRGELDLGIIEVEVSLGPQVGAPFPDFRFETMKEGENGTVAAHRGSYVLIDCWATWCAPCIAQIPNLRSAVASWKESPVTVLSISLDEDADRARRFIQEKEMNWPQGMLGSRNSEFIRQQLGISSVPMHFVLDAEGKLLHRAFKLHSAIDFLNERLA